MLVNFMIIGAQKCGTTTLAEQLASHEQICFCAIKEPGYFHATPDWKAKLADYHQLYTPKAGQICGEASTMYTFLPEWLDTHVRLHAYNPDLKLIYIMRHPVERVISNYAHRLVRRTVKQAPEQAVFADINYINRSRYGVQIRPYLELFPRENVLLLIFEEYIANQAKTLQQIAEFLAIAPDGFHLNRAEPRVTHRSVGEHYWGPMIQTVRDTPIVAQALTYLPQSLRTGVRQRFGTKLDQKPEFSPALRKTIWRFVEDDVSTIEGLLGRRLDCWRQGYTE